MVSFKTFEIVHYKLTNNYVVIEKYGKEYLKLNKITGGATTTYSMSEMAVLKSMEECRELIRLYIEPVPKTITEEKWQVKE